MRTREIDALFASLENIFLGADSYAAFVTAALLIGAILFIVSALSLFLGEHLPVAVSHDSKRDIEHICFISEREIYETGPREYEKITKELDAQNRKNFPHLYRTT